jgi:alpha-1,3-rhamnosyl/mannosyltransferase
MKIVLNGLSVVYPISGVGQYTLHLGQSLGTLLGPENVFWFGKDFRQKNDPYSNQNGSVFFHQIQYGMKKVLRKIPGSTTYVHVWRNHQFQSFTQRLKPSLYHETKYALFDFEDGLTLTTIYDLSFFRHPEWHPIDRVKHFENFCLKKLSQVEAIITISEFSRKEISDLLTIDPTKIHVTPLGIDTSFHPERDRFEGLPSQYILFLGNLEPRKNLPRLMAAYQSLPQSLRRGYPLVIAGAKGWGTEEVKKTLLSFRRDEKPIFTGYIPQSLLPSLYRGASLFVYPSLYEGFGLPVLEAMASGVPVIASDSTSLPEVVGDAGVLVNPYDVDDLKEAMVELLEDEKKRLEMAEKGIARAKLFSWEKCARETITVYEKVLSEKV